jgi:hypothetical protein
MVGTMVSQDPGLSEVRFCLLNTENIVIINRHAEYKYPGRHAKIAM